MRFLRKTDRGAEVELEGGVRAVVPSEAVPEGVEEGSEFRPRSRGASSPQPRQPRNRQQQAVRFFIDRGWEPHQAAGIVGNLMQESGSSLKPDAVGDNGTAHGIAQWRGDRYRGLLSFADNKGTDPEDFYTQLEYTDWELRNTEKAAGQALRQAKDVNEATDAVIGFERPQGWKPGDPSGAHGRSNRLRFARGVAESFDPNADIRPPRAARERGAGRRQSSGGVDLDPLPKPPSDGDGETTLGDVISDAGAAFAESYQEPRINLPRGPNFEANRSMFQSMANSGPLPNLRGGFQDIFGSRS